MPSQPLTNSPLTIRHQLIAASGSLLLIVFAVSQAWLHASLFDYRFGLAALSTCVLGLAAGMAVNSRIAARLARGDTAMWLAASGLSAALAVSVGAFVPFGTISSFLLITVLSATPFAFWSIGMALLHREYGTSIRRLLWITIGGAIIGATLSAGFLTLAGGPLAASALTAAALCLSAISACRHWRAIVLSVAGFAVLGFTAFYNHWDFSSPPRWVQEEGAPAKPLYANATLENQATRLTTQWNEFSRTDVMAIKTMSENLLWLYTNGTFSGLIPTGRPGGQDTQWLAEHFPLITLPLLARRPQNILTINSGTGLESRMAADTGVSNIRSMESNPALKNIMDQRPAPSTHSQIKQAYGDIRNTLRHDSDRYDQIYLSIATDQVPGWTERGPTESYLYTKEAFRDYWEHLKPGGMLVVLAGEETLYMRALLTAWDTLKKNPADGDDSLVSQAWGFQKVPVVPLMTPHQYLLMLVKGTPAEGMTTRIQELTKNLPVVQLFGPGITPPNTFNIQEQPYYILYHPDGLEMARTALGEYMSWSLKAPVDMTAATDRRPFFFQNILDPHPFLKTLAGICLALQTAVFLLPLAAERRLDHPASNARLPLPVFLSYFILLGAGAILAAIALAHQSALLIGRSDLALVTVVIAMLLGMGTGAAAYRHHIGRNITPLWYGTAVASAILIGLLYCILDTALEMAAGWPASLRVIVVGGITLPIGLSSAMLFMFGLNSLSRILAALVPWAWITFGIAIPGGAVMALWIAPSQGWGTVWIITGGCYIVMAALSIWLRRQDNRNSLKGIPAPA